MTDTMRPDQIEHAASLCAVFQDTVRHCPDAEALRSSDGLTSLTYREYGERVREIAAGFAQLGVQRGDAVAIMLTNRPEFHLIDAALMHLGATPFSIYNTSSPGQIDYVFSAAGNRIVICEAQFVERIRNASEQHGIEHVVCVDGAVEGTTTLEEVVASRDAGFDFDAAWRGVSSDDVLTLIFTSGTTGKPKAVEITHGNVCYAVATLLDTPELRGTEGRGGRVLSWLPDAHMANRLFAHYAPLSFGATVVTVRDAKTVLNVLQDTHPTMFTGVPMIWYKLKTAVERLLAAESAERQQLTARAIEIGLEKVRYEVAGQPVPPQVQDRYAEADRVVLSGLRASLGLDQIAGGISGGAPIAPDALEYLMAIGVPVLEGWAMSETSGAGILNPPGRIKLGTIGLPVPGTEIRQAEDGELLVRSPGVMRGYRNDPVQTAEAVDADGWLHTGDIVTVDDDGYVTIVDRKKELIINSAGKNMSPAHIENAVRVSCPVVGSVVAIGDRRPCVVALITLDPEAATGFAAAHQLADSSPAALAGHPEIRAQIAAGIEVANASLSRVEQVKAFTILPAWWLPDSEELTPTMKLKRRVIAEKYAAEIAQLYHRPRADRPEPAIVSS